MDLTADQIAAAVQKGAFKPHMFLTNLCMSFFQEDRGQISREMFPIVPVRQSSAFFYEFDKADLARDNMTRKPEMGRVAPAIFGKRDHTYLCKVDQVITGIDQIATLDFSRHGPAILDYRRSKSKYIAEQMNIHSDILWARAYFNAASWGSSFTGTEMTPSGDTFYHFDNENSDPVKFFDGLRTEMVLRGLRRPNKMCLGINAFNALKNNESILERIKFQGSEANPANVTTNVLAQLFSLDKIVVSEAVHNTAPVGAEANMEFICSPNDALLCYTTNSPAIDEPSAGYTFAWDMLGDGNHMAVRQFEGEGGTHTEFIEGLMATDHKITCKDLGVFLTNAAKPATESK